MKESQESKLVSQELPPAVGQTQKDCQDMEAETIPANRKTSSNTKTDGKTTSTKKVSKVKPKVKSSTQTTVKAKDSSSCCSKAIDLDSEAILLSNDILSVQQPKMADEEMIPESVISKDRKGGVKTASKDQGQKAATQKDLGNLDHEAIKLSNDILNQSTLDLTMKSQANKSAASESNKVSASVRDHQPHFGLSTKPTQEASKPVNNSNLGSLDHDAIRLTNLIFSNTTQVEGQDQMKDINSMFQMPKVNGHSHSEVSKLEIKSTAPTKEPAPNKGAIEKPKQPGDASKSSAQSENNELNQFGNIQSPNLSKIRKVNASTLLTNKEESKPTTLISSKPSISGSNTTEEPVKKAKILENGNTSALKAGTPKGSPKVVHHARQHYVINKAKQSEGPPNSKQKEMTASKDTSNRESSNVKPSSDTSLPKFGSATSNKLGKESASSGNTKIDEVNYFFSQNIDFLPPEAASENRKHRDKESKDPRVLQYASPGSTMVKSSSSSKAGFYGQDDYSSRVPKSQQQPIAQSSSFLDESSQFLKSLQRSKGPENPEVNKHRPSCLGPSRFEGGSYNPLSTSTSTGRASILKSDHNQYHNINSNENNSNSSSGNQQQPYRPVRNQSIADIHQHHVRSSSPDGNKAGSPIRAANNSTSNSTSRHQPYSMAHSASSFAAFGGNTSTTGGSNSPETSRRNVHYVAATPETSRRTNFDRNFNTSPVPFQGGRYCTVHFSDVATNQSYNPKTSSYSYSASTLPPTGSGSSKSASTVTFSDTVVAGTKGSPKLTASHHSHHNSSHHNHHHSSYSTSPSAYVSRGSRNDFGSSGLSSATRAKSEDVANGGGGGRQLPYTSYGSSSNSHQSTSINNGSSSSSELFKKIQASKDAAREDFDRAMNFDRNAPWKPVAIVPKLPRPGPEYNRFGAPILTGTSSSSQLSSEVTTASAVSANNRRLAREKVVIDRVLGDRTLRSGSLESSAAASLLSKSASSSNYFSSK